VTGNKGRFKLEQRRTNKPVDLDTTRIELRHAFALWDLDPSEYEILWEEDKNNIRSRLPGAIVQFTRSGKRQEISCRTFLTRAQNLRQCYLLIERLRIAEKNGVQYQGLTYSKDLAPIQKVKEDREDLMEAYDVLGCSPSDSSEFIHSVYQTKVKYYHPDTNTKDSNPEKFKKIQEAYDKIMASREVKP
jgi:DnaJ-domain-containing protein 1